MSHIGELSLARLRQVLGQRRYSVAQNTSFFPPIEDSVRGGSSSTPASWAACLHQFSGPRSAVAERSAVADIPGDRVVIARGARSRCSFSPPVEGFTTQFFWRIIPASLQGLEENECSISSSAGISCWRMICRPGKKRSDCATRNTVWITSSSRRRNQFRRAPAHRLTVDHEW
jgi:hypothetical protein